MPVKRSVHRVPPVGRTNVQTPNGWAVGRVVRAIGARGGRLASRSRAAVRRSVQLGIARGMLKAARFVLDTDEQAVAVAESRGSVGWDGVCRRSSRETVTMEPRETAILRARIDAIVARSNEAKRSRGTLRLV